MDAAAIEQYLLSPPIYGGVLHQGFRDMGIVHGLETVAIHQLNMAFCLLHFRGSIRL